MGKQGKIGSTLIFILTRPFAILPLGFHRVCGKVIGRFCGKVLRYRRDVVMINLSRCFPDKKYDELQSICDRFYEHFGKIFCEAVWFGGSSNPKRLIESKIVSVDNPEVINELYDKGKSVIIMGGHDGNWELFGGFRYYNSPVPLKFTEYNTAMVYRKLSSAAWEDFMAKNRTRPVKDKKAVEGMVDTFGIMRFVITHKDERYMYSFVTDQFPYTSSSMADIDFFGQKTVTMNGAPVLAKKFGFALVYMSMKEEENGNYTMHYTKMCEDASSLEVKDLLRQYYDLLEDTLREQPWNYLWSHKRWK